MALETMLDVAHAVSEGDKVINKNKNFHGSYKKESAQVEMGVCFRVT